MRVAVCPGSFDPITLGHLDIIARAAPLFDRLYVAVLENTSKRPLFTVEERLELLREATAHLPTVVCESFTGLVVEYAARRQARVIVRGVRSALDFDYEVQMASMNKQLAPDVETLLIPTAPQYAQVSSTLVKEVAAFGGRVDQWVPAAVGERLYAKLRGREGATG